MDACVEKRNPKLYSLDCEQHIDMFLMSLCELHWISRSRKGGTERWTYSNFSFSRRCGWDAIWKSQPQKTITEIEVLWPSSASSRRANRVAEEHLACTRETIEMISAIDTIVAGWVANMWFDLFARRILCAIKRWLIKRWTWKVSKV